MSRLKFINSDKKPLVKLYRYFSNIDYALKEITSGEIYLTLSDSFNDPFDCKISNDGSSLLANQKDKVNLILHYVDKILLECHDFITNFFLEYDFDAMQKEFIGSIATKKEITPFEYLYFIHAYSKRKDSFDEFIELLKLSYIKNSPLFQYVKELHVLAK